MSYKRKGRSGIIDNKANTVFDKFEYLINPYSCPPPVSNRPNRKGNYS